MIPLHDDNPTERTPVVTIAFIAACVLVFFYQASLPAGSGDTFVFQYGAIPALVFGEADLPEMGVAIPAYATLITSMFLHGGWMHLIGNMLYLWVFGNNIEDVMGHCEVRRVLPHMRNSGRLEPRPDRSVLVYSHGRSKRRHFRCLRRLCAVVSTSQRAGYNARPGHNEGGSGCRPRHVDRDATVERGDEHRQYGRRRSILRPYRRVSRRDGTDWSVQTPGRALLCTKPQR